MNFLSEDLIVIPALNDQSLVADVASVSAAIDILPALQKDIAILAKTNLEDDQVLEITLSHCDTSDGVFVVLDELAFKESYQVVSKNKVCLLGIKHDQLKRYVKVSVKTSEDDIVADVNILALAY